MGLPSTGDPRERGLLSGTCGGAEEGVPSIFLKKMVLGVPVRFTRIRCKKWGCNKRKTAQVTPIKAQIRLIFRDRLNTVQMLCWFGEAVPLFRIQPGSEYYKRQFCTSKAAGVGPRCIETRSLAAGLGHRWSSQEGRGVDPAFYSSYSHAGGRPAGP